MNEFVMERRPHWDFDLVEAVKAASTKYGAGTVDSAYAVIAAVEDWRNSNIQVHWQGMTATERNLSEALGREQHGRDELEAAIKRVRDLHCLTVDELDGPEGPEDVEHCQECGYISIDAEPCPTLLALDGPQ